MTALIILGIVLQICFIYVEHREKYVPAVTLKGCASLCFVILGFICSASTTFESWVTMGLVLGMLGDIFLNLRYVFKDIGSKIFLIGIFIFMLGHVMYLIALLGQAERAWIPVIAGIILAALLLIWIFSKVTAQKAFKIFGIFYVGTVSLMAVTAIWNMIILGGSAAAMFAVGGILFLVSDVVLIFNTFTGTTKFSMRITNLSLYYIGQILIAMSLKFIS